MACRFEYKGKEYTQDELAKELEKMLPSEAYKFIPDVQNLPNAPFKTSWPDLLLKRVIRQAVEENKDAISWTPGEAQAARYDLSKQITELRWNKTNNDLQAKDHNGKVVIREQVGPDKLTDYVGKEAADKLINSPTDKSPNKEIHFLSGLDLKVGGEGMMKFYDDMLVAKANAISKKYGSKVEQKEIQKVSDLRYEYNGPDLDINELKSKSDKLKLTAREDSQLTDIANAMHNGETFKEAISKYGSKALAEKYGGELKPIVGKQTIHVLKLTPELKAKALKEGFPLFSAGVTPVDHTPEFEDRKKPKITPVDYNPFLL